MMLRWFRRGQEQCDGEIVLGGVRSGFRSITIFSRWPTLLLRCPSQPREDPPPQVQPYWSRGYRRTDKAICLCADNRRLTVSPRIAAIGMLSLHFFSLFSLYAIAPHKATKLSGEHPAYQRLFVNAFPALSVPSALYKTSTDAPRDRRPRSLP